MRRFVFLSLLGLMTSCPGSLVLRVEMFPLSEELVPSFDQIEVEWVSPSDQDRFTLDAGGSTLPLAFELLFPASVRGELIQFTVRGLTQAGEQAVWQADFLAEPGTTVQVFAEFCGDGVLQPELGEECDDGSQNSNAQPGACRVTCEIAFCGDGVLDQGEECDDANLIEGDGCDSNCSFPACQNGIASPGELCLLVQSELNGLPNPFRVINLDATGNGSLDLVVLHPTFNTIRFYKNLGGGSFALASDFTLSGFVNDIASFRGC